MFKYRHFKLVQISKTQEITEKSPLLSVVILKTFYSCYKTVTSSYEILKCNGNSKTERADSCKCLPHHIPHVETLLLLSSSAQISEVEDGR